MSPRHHPSHDALRSFARGEIALPQTLWIGTHLSRCKQCAAFVAAEESQQAHAFWDDISETPSSLNLDISLDQIISSPRHAKNMQAEDNSEIPAFLQPWMPKATRFRHMAPGVSRLALLGNSNESAIHLWRIDGALRIPRHAHTSTEYTTILRGDATTCGVDYSDGDSFETDEAGHSLVIGAEGCLALVCGARAQFRHWSPRWLHRIVQARERLFQSR